MFMSPFFNDVAASVINLDQYANTWLYFKLFEGIYTQHSQQCRQIQKF